MSTVAKSTKTYSGFDPRIFGGCILWLDGGDSNMFTYSSGSNVSTWVSKISNTTFTQSGTAGRLTRTTYQGFPTVFFDSDGTTNAFMSGSLSLPSAFTVVQVLSPLAYSSGTWSFIWSWAYGATNNRVPGFRSSNASPDFQPYITWVGNGTNSLAVTQGTRYVNFVEFTNSAANTSYSINGNTPTSGTLTATNFSPTTFLLGGDGPSAASVFGRFYLSELLIFSNQLSLPQRQTIEGYLAQKWGLQSSISASHPYKSIGIFTRPLQPVDISGCVMWFDAADTTTFTFSSGSNISVWSNKAARTDSIAVWDSVATRVSPGTLGNSVPHVRFSNYAYSSAILGYGGNNGETIFMVGNNPSTTLWLGATRWVTVPPNTNPAAWPASHILNVRGNAVRGEIQGSATGVTVSAGTRTKLGVSVVTASTMSVFESGTPGANPVALTLNQVNGNIRVGTPVGTASDLGELIYYNRALTTEERQCVEGYLAQKWGLQSNLPTTHPFYLSRVIPSTAIFSPTNLSNCTLWIDAADTATITFSNANILSINDKSATAYNLTRSYTAGFEITYTNRLNGLPTLLFPNDPVDNNSTRTFLTSATNFTMNTSLHACFFVMRFNPYVVQGTSTPRSWGQLFPFNINTVNGLQCGPARTTSNWFMTYSVQNVGNTASNTTVMSSSSNGPAAPGLPVIGSIVRTGSTTYIISYNGILQSVTGGSTLVAASGAARIGIYFQNQELCELLFYNGVAMPLDDIRKVEGYLAWKWGLQATLPVTHPYYQFRP